MSQSALSFDAVDDRGTGIYGFALVTSAGCLCCGVAILFFAGFPERWMGIPLAAVGIGGVIWAFRALPQIKYYTYFSLSDSGILYRDAPGSKDIFYSWNRVRDARALVPFSDDGIGIEITVTSTTGYPDTRWLRMQLDHVDQAMSAVQAKLARNPSSNRALESGRAEERHAAQRER